MLTKVVRLLQDKAPDDSPHIAEMEAWSRGYDSLQNPPHDAASNFHLFPSMKSFSKANAFK